jgi:hypothetical protein
MSRAFCANHWRKEASRSIRGQLPKIICEKRALPHVGMSNQDTLRTAAVAKAMGKNKPKALSAMSSAFDALLASEEITEDPPPPPPPPMVPQVEEKRELSPTSKKKLIEEKMSAWAGGAPMPTSALYPPLAKVTSPPVAAKVTSPPPATKVVAVAKTTTASPVVSAKVVSPPVSAKTSPARPPAVVAPLTRRTSAGVLETADVLHPRRISVPAIKNFEIVSNK